MMDPDTTSKMELLVAVFSENLNLDNTDYPSLPFAAYVSTDLYKSEIKKSSRNRSCARDGVRTQFRRLLHN